MRVIEKTVYAFDELSEAAKERARNWFRDGNLDYDWYDAIYEDAKRTGCEIKGFDLGRRRTCDLDLVESVNVVVRAILSEHGKGCDTFKLAAEYYRLKHDGDRMTEEEFTGLLAEEYWIMLERECEYLNSDESVDETILINEYEFYSDGSIA